MKRNVTHTSLKWFVLFTFVLFFSINSTNRITYAAAEGATYRVNVASGYLALRDAKAFDSRNEIAKLNNGDAVEVQNTYDATYWYVFVPKMNLYGYVNKDYLLADGETAVTVTNNNIWTVKVDKGYLALRTAKAYDSRNEIGKLYTGETVEVTDYSDLDYWYVYSAKYDKYGYVNKDYLSGGTVPDTANTYSVKVNKGYLALRSAKAYDSRNEIGKLNTGDTVQVSDYSDSTYWYVYAPSLNLNGYVNKDYLIPVSAPSYPTYTVHVKTGYLALRNAKAYDSRNEIGKLYTGETVQVQDTTDNQYWYVYAPTLDKYGYVNKDYLY